MAKQLDLLEKAKADREKVIKTFENTEKYRIPLDSFLNYCGTIGFTDYMQKCNVDPKGFSFNEVYNNMCACGADGQNYDRELTEMLEHELKLLNQLHKEISNKIYDINERIANLELSKVNEMPAGKEKDGLLHKIKTKLGNLKAYRESLAEKFENWKKQAHEREQARKEGKMKNKSYSNANDEMPEESKPEPECKTCKLKAWVKENQPVISLGLTIISITIAVMLLHHVKTNGK